MTSGEHTKGHTELPWHFEELGPHRTADGCGYIRSQADNLEISHHGDMGRSREENLANAHLIVTAVNAYPAVAELVESLMHCQSALAMVISPHAIQTSSVQSAFAQATEAECRARSALARFREAQAGGVA